MSGSRGTVQILNRWWGIIIMIAGNLPLSNLTMDLAGTTETLYDQIFVGNGAATLNGILNLMFVGTYSGPVYGSMQNV